MSRHSALLVLLVLSIIIFAALPASALAANPVYATKQFVQDSIAQFNQDVVQPLAARVGLLENQLADHEQRLESIEQGSQPPPVIADRAFVLAQAGPPSITQLIDTDDGRLVAQYDTALPAGGTCDGRRGFLNEDYQALTLVDAVTGEPIASHEAPIDHQFYRAVASCNSLSGLASPYGIAKDRLAIVWAPTGGPDWGVSLVNTDTGDLVAFYTSSAQTDAEFSCLGDSVLIARLGIFDSESGAKLRDAPEQALFLCARQ